jgi:hypothetical protein
MLLVRCARGLDLTGAAQDREDCSALRGLILLVSVQGESGQHLRHLGHLATHIGDPGFRAAWVGARDEHELRATLLRSERSLTLRIGTDAGTDVWLGQPLRSVSLPGGTLVALVRRAGREIIPNGSTVLEDGDRVTLIGSPQGIRSLQSQFPPIIEHPAADGAKQRDRVDA